MSPSTSRRLADEYDLSTLEPGVDRDKTLAFLDQSSKPKAEVPKIEGSWQREDPWKARTIRARASTIQLFDVMEAGQRTKRVNRTLEAGEPVSVQELADLAIRLLAKHLGYS